MFGLVLMAALYVTTGDNLQCMCGCCRGSGCKPEMLEPMFDLSSCTDDNCAEQCPSHFPEQCGQADSTVEGDCMPPMNK